MKPIRLSLTNFQSHRDTTLDLSAISCAVLSGPNGAGKSSLLDAIRFSLFGYARGGNLDTVVTEGMETCRVEYEFLLGDEHYLISRQRSRKGSSSTTLSFQRYGTIDSLGNLGYQVLDGKSSTETQQRICELLHMTDALFTQTACSNQGNAAAFSQAKPSERKQVLGEILDLGAWERRAEQARAMGKTAEAQRESKAVTLTDTEAKAATLPDLQAEAEQVAYQANEYRERAAAIEDAITYLSTQREDIVTLREADKASRRELEELEGRALTLTDAQKAAEKRLQDCTGQTVGKAGLLGLIKDSENSQAEASEMEAHREERERLTNEAKPLQEQIKAAKAAHEAAITQLETQLAGAKRHRDQQLKTLDGTLAELHKQATVLGSVPCVLQEAKLLAESCPLITQAREAEQRIPDLERQRNEIAEQTPWAEDESKIEEMRQQTPAADLIAQRDTLKAQYDAISYDAEAAAKAKQIASNLPGHQRKLAQVEAAEAQLPALKEALERAEAEAKQVTDRLAVLTESLGKPRDWDSDLRKLEAEAAETKASLERARSAIENLQRKHGELAAGIAAAEQAAEQVVSLRAEIASLDRRIQLLKLLGNTRDGAFSKGGIPALLIERAVPELEAAANEVLATLSDGRMAIELRTQKESSKNGMSETLDIAILTEAGERLRETLSGGEGTRVDLSLRAGLSLLLARRAGARCELMVLDEPPGLDEQGQDELIECLGRLSEHFSTTLLVTHIDRLKEALPVQLLVSKNGDGSKVEVVYR